MLGFDTFYIIIVKPNIAFNAVKCYVARDLFNKSTFLGTNYDLKMLDVDVI